MEILSPTSHTEFWKSAKDPSQDIWDVNRTSEDHVDNDQANNLLVISPYTDLPHLLNLNTVDTQCQILAKALTTFKSLRQDYATAPYIHSFNWTNVIVKANGLAVEAAVRWVRQCFYIVVFRSRIPPSTDRSHLGALDKVAHAEAVAGGGFLKYWFGTADESGRNLATCVWRNRQDAVLGSSGPGHRRACSATRVLYTEWKVEKLCLTIADGLENWKIENLE